MPKPFKQNKMIKIKRKLFQIIVRKVKNITKRFSITVKLAKSEKKTTIKQTNNSPKS